MRPLGIQSQILLTTLIPVVLIDLLFTYRHIDSSIEQAGELLQSKGQIIAQQIAGASEYNMFSGNDAQLRYLLEQSIDHDEVVRAAVFDQSGRRVAEAVSAAWDPRASADYRYLRQPIRSQSIVPTGAPAVERVETVGWVHLYLSRSQLQHTARRIITDSILFFAAILIMAVVVVTLVSRRITRPIYRLVDHLKDVETGQLGKPIEPVEGNEIGAVQMGFNRMTQALLAHRRHLNLRIQQATQQLNAAITDLEAKNREFGLARDEAQKANRIKSEFLANMSHEIRTPINGIKGFISLLGQSRLDATQRRYVDIVLKSTADLTNIVNEILDFSKMESGKLHLVDEEFDLYEVIEQTRDILFINLLARDIDLNLILYSDTPRRVIGDKLRLKQILLNLIGNAIKFTDEGRVAIRVQIESESDAEIDLAISVEDTGIGISPADQARLFKAFSQIEGSDSRRFTGTGLGLVISKNLATLMGGDIAMRSAAGAGSEFTLRLPLKKGRPDSPADPSATPRALIFAADKLCLMETRSLYERAGVDVESSLIEATTDVDAVRECLHRCLPHTDFLVFDLRHFGLDLDAILSGDFPAATRIILMHYDAGRVAEIHAAGEFVSVINTSRALARLLDPATQESPRSSPPVAPTGAARRVLLVDDNPVNLKLASELISLWGHEVTETDNGKAALRCYREADFDLVVLDIQMPDIDGVELLSQMRAAKPAARTPAVALTANIMDGEAERLLQRGFDYFLGKPIDESRFRALLDGAGPRAVAALPDDTDKSTTADCSLDPARSLALAADNPALLRQIFEILERDLPDHRGQLLKAHGAGDRERLGALAHKLHGVTCYASLPRLRRSVLALQQCLARNDATGEAELIVEIAAELDAIVAEVEAHLQGLRSAAQPEPD